MSIDDLRAVLAERAGSAPDASASTRIDGALGRARSIRRHRRIAAAAGASAVVAAAVAIISVPSLVTAPDPRPEPAIELDENGFRLYADGRVLLDSAVMEPGERSVELTSTPTAFPLAIVTECSADPTIEISVDGEPFSGGGCRGYTSGDESTWAARGVHAGEAAEFTMTSGTAIGDGERLAIAAYQDVPWGDYAFPPRPDVLPDKWTDVSADVELRSDPSDPNAPRRITVDYGWLNLQMFSQTPGIIRLRINGTDYEPIHFWDYGYVADVQRLYSNDPDDWPLAPFDTPVEIEVYPEGFTGGWQVFVTECARGGTTCPGSSS